MPAKQIDNDLIANVQKTLDELREGVGWLRAGVVIFGVVSVISSLAVSTFTAELGPIGIKVLAFVAAASTGLMTAFGFVHRLRDFRNARALLNTALMKYRVVPDYKDTELIDAWAEAQRMVGDLAFTPPPSKKP